MKGHPSRRNKKGDIDSENNFNIEDKTISKIILAIILLLATPIFLNADNYIYDNPYGGKKIGRVKDGVVYDSPYGGKKAGRIEENGRLRSKGIC